MCKQFQYDNTDGGGWIKENYEWPRPEEKIALAKLISVVIPELKVRLSDKKITKPDVDTYWTNTKRNCREVWTKYLDNCLPDAGNPHNDANWSGQKLSNIIDELHDKTEDYPIWSETLVSPVDVGYDDDVSPQREEANDAGESDDDEDALDSVSYTHLTLPTKA